MSVFVDLNGDPIGVLAWGELFSDYRGRILAENPLGDGTALRTMWTGHNDPASGILPFGTVIAYPGGPRVTEVAQYTSREDALAGHTAELARRVTP